MQYYQEGKLRLVVELPGVEKEEAITSEVENRKYRAEISLKREIRPPIRKGYLQERPAGRERHSDGEDL